MRKLTLILAMLAAFVVAPGVANAQGFLLGVLAGGMLFGGSTQYGAGGAAILYSASDEELKATDPLTVRMVSDRRCFDSSRVKKRNSLGELFWEFTKDMPERKRTILQVARVFSPSSTWCASTWFTYIDE